MTVALLSGPTASGKTAIALEFAEQQGAIEIINADSLLFYRGADIGTAKPSPEERARVRHHLIDVRDPGERVTAGEFRRLALQAIAEIESRSQRALVVGGSGFYLKALRHGIWDAPPSDPTLRAEIETLKNTQLHAELSRLDPESAARIGANDRYRLVRALEIIRLSGRTPSELRAEEEREPDLRFPLLVVDRTDAELDQRIAERARLMIEEGLLEETRALEERHGANPVLDSVGYAQARAYLRGEKPAGRKIADGVAGLAEEIGLATRQLARSQRSWFRKQPARADFQLEADRDRLLGRLRELYPRNP